MHKRLLFLLLAFAVGGMILYGCSDEDDNGANNDTVITDGQLDSAFAVLMRTSRGMMDSVIGHGGYLTGYEYAGLHAIFTGYLSAHPGHSKASFGAAMTSMLVMTSSDQVGPYLDSLLDMGRGLLDMQVGLPYKLTDRRNICLLPADLPSIGIERNFLARSYFSVITRATAIPTQFSQIQAGIRQYALPAVNGSLAYTNSVLADTNYVCWLTPEMMADTAFDSIEIDRTDFLAYAAGLSTVKSFMHLAVAYDVDFSGWNATGISEILDQQGDWMSLHSDGGAQMAAARNAFLDGVELAGECLTALEDERVNDTDQDNDLLGGAWFDELDIDSGRVLLGMAEAFLTDTVWIPWDSDDDDVDDDSTRVSVRNVFENPLEVPAKFAPPYAFTITPTWDTIWDSSFNPAVVDSIDSFYNLLFTWEAYSIADWHFPDPSFNGIFIDITTDTALIRVFDIDTSDWDKTDTMNVPMAPTLEWFQAWYEDRWGD